MLCVVADTDRMITVSQSPGQVEEQGAQGSEEGRNSLALEAGRKSQPQQKSFDRKPGRRTSSLFLAARNRGPAAFPKVWKSLSAPQRSLDPEGLLHPHLQCLFPPAP